MSAGHRADLLAGLRRFVLAAHTLPEVRRIALVESIVTTKPDPKDVDVLVTVTDDADLSPLATLGRRLTGHTQGFNRGADIFLANVRGEYIGRTCPWKVCQLGVRMSCDARLCGQRPHLHDDLDVVTLHPALVAAPPVTLWPVLHIRCAIPADLQHFLATMDVVSDE